MALTNTAMLGRTTVPTATATRYVASDRYLAEVCRANAAEARVDELAERCARLEEDLEAMCRRCQKQQRDLFALAAQLGEIHEQQRQEMAGTCP